MTRTITAALASAALALAAAACSAILGIDDVREGSITPDAPAMCYIDSVLNFVDVETSQDTAVLTGTADTRILLTAPLNTDAAVDYFDLGLYAGLGAFSGTDVEPGTYAIDTTESSYDTCGVCVVIYADTTSNGTTLQFRASYLANAGTVTITQVSPTLVATFANLKFRHVDINAETNVSTVVNDGCQTAISSGTIDMEYTDADSPDAGVGFRRSLKGVGIGPATVGRSVR